MRFMKDLMNRKDDFLKQIQRLPDDAKENDDSFDLFAQSSNEMSKSWSDSLKEFEELYPQYLKDEETNRKNMNLNGLKRSEKTFLIFKNQFRISLD